MTDNAVSNAPPDARTRTIHWDNPQISAAAARTMTGLEYFQAMQRGDLPPPPITKVMSMSMLEIEVGRVVFAATPGEEMCNPNGVIHGGWICTMLDSAMTCTVQSALPQGTLVTTMDLQTRFIRPVLVTTGELRAEGELIHMGKRVAMATGRLVGADGKLYAHATTSCMLLPIEG